MLSSLISLNGAVCHLLSLLARTSVFWPECLLVDPSPGQPAKILAKVKFPGSASTAGTRQQNKRR